jgi:hypothetical protein
MRFVTTINPNGRYDRQRECINSWHNMGIPVYALQLPEEIELVSQLYPDVTVIEATPVDNGTWSKQTPSLDSVVQTCKRQNCILINSDIELTFNDPEEFKQAFVNPTTINNVLVLGIRLDILNNASAKFNPYGIDVFRLTPDMLNVLPSTAFALGMPGWDYWIPFYLATQHKYKIRTYFKYQVQHVEHDDRWNQQDQQMAWDLIRQYTGLQTKKVSAWIQQRTGRISWNRQSSYAQTTKILRGYRTVYEA